MSTYYSVSAILDMPFDVKPIERVLLYGETFNSQEFSVSFEDLSYNITALNSLELAQLIIDKATIDDVKPLIQVTYQDIAFELHFYNSNNTLYLSLFPQHNLLQKDFVSLSNYIWFEYYIKLTLMLCEPFKIMKLETSLF